MDKKTAEEVEVKIAELIGNPPYDVAAIIGKIDNAGAADAEALTIAALKAFSTARNFDGALQLVQAHYPVLEAKLSAVGVRDALRDATDDRLIRAYVESVGFGERSARRAIDPVERLLRLLSFRKGVFVLHSEWGLGEIMRLDDFYRRVTVDFRNRRDQQFSFEVAADALLDVPEKHILYLQRQDPENVERMIKEKPGEFVKSMLSSFGDMTVVRLEELSARYGFVKSANWKKFWDLARADLRKDRLVDIPARRAEPLHLKATAETYGDAWFSAFTQLKDPKSILSSVREFEALGKVREISDESRDQIAKRLAFALKGARGVDDALYARIAFCLDELKLDEASVVKARNYLWEGDRYIAAARDLPSRETGALVVFLTAADREATKLRLFEALPRMCFSFLSETLNYFINDADCEDAATALLRDPEAPPTLVTLVLGRYSNFKHWSKLPPLVVILTHAIALGEGRQSGETLKMQNMVRRLFSEEKWLKDTFAQLSEADQALFFERFQASIAWEPSSHQRIVVRMTHIVPSLADRLVRHEEVKKVERITSIRSYAERQAAYEKLVKVDIPNNTKRIEFARSYGDLSENAEYQYAKDEQRALLQKQQLMQDDLNNVRAVDFADVEVAEVCPGAMVTIVSASGERRVYTVLGEWDDDPERGILSNLSQLARNMLGKKAGDTFELPAADGSVSVGTIEGVAAITDEIREWIKSPKVASV